MIFFSCAIIMHFTPGELHEVQEFCNTAHPYHSTLSAMGPKDWKQRGKERSKHRMTGKHCSPFPVDVITLRSLYRWLFLRWTHDGFYTKPIFLGYAFSLFLQLMSPLFANSLCLPLPPCLTPRLGKRRSTETVALSPTYRALSPAAET